MSEEYFTQAQARDNLPELYRHVAEAALLAGDLIEAEAQSRKALDLARELAMRAEEGHSLRVLGEIARARGQGEDAELYLRQSLTILEEVGDAYAGARSRLSLAQLYFSQSRQTQGLAELDKCMVVFQRLDAAMDLATAQALHVEGQLASQAMG
jgi:tetratricopeptide (TPR) repeat protein